jgi:hypothetical protein
MVTMEQMVFNIQAQASTDLVRTESFMGREYLVVPAVALVEGVLHSANAEHPELALASEFGRYPSAWDGRPLVLNHPRVDGHYVSANSPEILRDWSFGVLFNTRLDGLKLKTEAWIDVARANELGGDFVATVDRIKGGQMVELSTGLFATVERVSGLYQGLEYKGIWRSIAPDHLAFLSAGTLGACSIAGGCGAPRINTFRYVKSSTNSTNSANSADSACDCGCNGACNKGEPAVTEANSLPASEEKVFEVSEAVGKMSCSDEGQSAINATTFTSTSTPKQGEPVMSKDNDNGATEVTAGDVTPESAQIATAALTANSTPSVPSASGTPSTPSTPSTPKVLTAAEYIAQAPAEVREVLQESLRLHAEKKASLITNLKATERCDYTEDELRAMSVRDLERLVKLASVPVTYAPPSAPRTNMVDDRWAPPPPQAFEIKRAATAV